MQKIHKDILNYLLKKREDDSDLFFTLRSTNRNKKLDKGFWFHGNEEYLAISFWDGMDWNNRTPNIYLKILNDGRSFLEFAAKDSENKWFFFSEIIPKYINELESFGKKRLKKDYSEFKNNYLKSLDYFLKNDKKLIDEALLNMPKKLRDEMFSTKRNTLGFLNKNEFNTKLNNTLSYISNKPKENKGLPFYIKSLKIKNYPPIIKTEINNLSEKNQWIFLTGMNGTGKSSILKALTIAIINNSDNGKILLKDEDFEIQLQVSNNSKTEKTIINKNKGYNPTIISPGFAAYGASRQMMIEDINDKKSSIAYSIFNNDGKLLNLDFQIADHIRKQNPLAEERISQISLLLADIIPSLVKIEMPENTIEGLHHETYYIEEDENENELPAVFFHELASGLKSLIAMIGDMCSRLYAQQPEISDPAELKGIVIIDEIDIHLHPVLQKELVEILTDTFPLVQFIASTHSPIPFLGAPENSVIYNITRSAENGTEAKRIKNVNIKNLLPNTLLTSPIFGMDSLTPNSNKNKNDLNVDDHFNDTKLFELVDKKIDELFERGKSKNSKYFQ
ncbi:AAA family ATPase [Marinigracilibium pacificum]|uniref:AAA family ATPase n=1 Tax=Marinigracilibium pacificum TaxID=2729599 RepID=A0A848J637_9BACT|nr:AAA family ATPase [Marinigracilibium pacificum]NMM49839.1 AAA family ATPase [Marinigracilibium pacificum]